MKKLRRIARKLTGGIFSREQKFPESPVKAMDTAPSMIFSLDDDPHVPTRRLIEIALDAIRRAMDEVNLDDLAERAPKKDYFPNVWPGEHYKLLAGLMLSLKPQRVIEIGTYTGLSALCMKKYLPAEGQIVTFDIKDRRADPDTILRDPDFTDGRLRHEVANLADPAVLETHRALLESTDFMFVDGPKDNVTEFQFIENFRKLRFNTPPILLFDDTRLWSMLRFWRELAYPKLDLTSFGHWSGTGLVEWRQG